MNNPDLQLEKCQVNSKVACERCEPDDDILSTFRQLRPNVTFFTLFDLI
jgi:hypothetical protein